MSDSGTLTLKFESTDEQDLDFKNSVLNFVYTYGTKSYTRATETSNNTFEFYFDRCWHFEPEVLVSCSIGMNVRISALYHIHGDGTDPDISYSILNGTVSYSGIDSDGNLIDNEYVDLDNLYE